MDAHHAWGLLSPPEHFRYPPVAVQATGPYAAFTRPEFTSERFSYSVMTPTAAVGLLRPTGNWSVESSGRRSGGPLVAGPGRGDQAPGADSRARARKTSELDSLQGLLFCRALHVAFREAAWLTRDVQ